MPDEQSAAVEAEFHELTGALTTLVKLREEFAGWTDLPEDDGNGGTLDRVLAYIQSLESAYRSRKVLLEEQFKGR